MKRIVKLLPLMLALAIVLSGCNLIDVNQVALIEKDQAATQKEYQETVMAEYDGGKVSKEDILPVFYSNYSYMSYMYSMYGMQVDAQTANSMVEDATEVVVENVALNKQFEERGLALEKTDEEYMTEAQTTFDGYVESAMESAEGSTEEEKRANAVYTLYQQGYTADAIAKMNRDSAVRTAVEENVKAEIAEVTDEELQAAYDAQVASDEETYSENPTQIEKLASSEDAVITWMPEGYRTVKHILVKPEDEVLQAVTDARNALKTAKSDLDTLNSELEALNASAEAETTEETTEETVEETASDEPARSAEEIQADIDAKTAEIPALEAAVDEAETACIASVQDKLDEIYAKLAEEGADFDTVMAEYGEDPGMQSEPAMSTGYYVSADSTTWDENFTKAAMALTAVGEYSAEPVITTSGVHIVYYNADVTPGAVSLETVHDALYKSTLETMQDDHYDSELKSWVDAMNVTYHLDSWVIS